MAPPNREGSDGLVPESPGDAGVSVPGVPIEKVEGERLLENEVRARLEHDGFNDDQILEWLEAYFAEHDEGNADEVVAWIRGREKSERSPGSSPD
jgi:hypothetical protein